MSRIALFWALLMGFLLGAIAWWLKDVEHHLMWPIMGVVVGTLMVVSYHIAARQGRGVVKRFTLELFGVVSVGSALLARFFPAAFGFGAGLWFPALIGAIVFHVIKKRLLLLQDLR